MTNLDLNKIQHFVKDQLNRNIVITNINNGYKINNFKVQFHDRTWTLFDSNQKVLGTYLNKRLAILSAVYAVRKDVNSLQYITGLDNYLYTLKHDVRLFEYRINKKKENKVAEDRYSRSLFELDQLYNDIRRLEKSAGLY